MKSITSYVGLDMHKSMISVAVAEEGRRGEVRHYGVVANRADILTKLAERLARHGGQLRLCYEAGPCGYGLHRLLIGLGHDCTVVAPSRAMRDLVRARLGLRQPLERHGLSRFFRNLLKGEIHNSAVSDPSEQVPAFEGKTG